MTDSQDTKQATEHQKDTEIQIEKIQLSLQ